MAKRTLTACLLIAAVSLTAQATKAALPRTADGQPDIQGVWANKDTGSFTTALESRKYLAKLGLPSIGVGTTSHIGLPTRPPLPDHYIADPPGGIIPYQPWAFERRNSVMRNFHKPQRWQVDPQTLGWPGGLPRMHVYSSWYAGPWQVMQGPGYVLFLYETQHEFRYVPLDGRGHPGRDIKLWMGSSRGRWEGNTLVIESTNHSDSTRFTIIGDFHSDEMKLTERFTYKDKDTLEYRATIDDPKVFTQPWSIALTNKRFPDNELMEFAGVEGEKAVERWLPPTNGEQR